MHARRSLVGILVVFAATAAYAGGWAIVTVDDLPAYAVAGKPVTLTFTVRQHGVTRLSGLKPSVRATASGRPDVQAAAVPAGTSGDYSATLRFAGTGVWTIRIDSGFNAIATTLLPMNVIEPGTALPAPLSPAARGQHLFVAKGCIGCHRHQQVAAETLVSVGPDLTGKRFPPDYLRAFLADPAKALKRAGTLESAPMPNLNLHEPEIAALSAFLNGSEGGTR